MSLYTRLNSYPQTGNLIAETPDRRWYTDLTEIETTDFGNCSFMEV